MTARRSNTSIRLADEIRKVSSKNHKLGSQLATNFLKPNYWAFLMPTDPIRICEVILLKLCEEPFKFSL